MTSLFVIEANRVLLNQAEGEPKLIKGGITSDSFSVIHSFYRGWIPFGYLRDVQGVWWFDGRKTKVTLVSRSTDEFRVLDDDYGLDAKHVYLEDKLIPNSDAASFELLPGSPYFAKDKHRLYVKNGDRFHTWDDINVETAVAQMDYCTDRDHVFHLYNSLSYANSSKDQLLGWLQETYPHVQGWWQPDYNESAHGAERIQGQWYKTDQAVFYCEEFGGSGRKETRLVYNLVRGADPASFEVFNDQYARDAAGVYCTWRKATGTDQQTFEALGGLFGRDSQNIFYNGYAVAGADRDTFQCLLTSGSLGLSKDNNHVYRAQFVRTSRPFGHPDYVLEQLPGADAKSFTIWSDNGSWAVDQDHVYQWGDWAKKLDRASFTYLFDHGVESWAYDKHGLYNANGRRTVKGIDGQTFQAFNRYWGKDEHNVFCFTTGGIQRAADAATFRVTDKTGGAEDANFTYVITDDGTIQKSKKK
ncbi:DKNYY domain-containing protein [Paenibacillus sp. ACRSA]|uniref:DKNYY domain-containing protein n=1 Tax=Paenibacillus sp. ACRSA TaxID=2918211 RepID=UPI001EF68630|nr:DKNYY domain-containing protein [Paenibacillus sp. ACRSA]MCG7379745.1 DKNYY domain-containing protein [Paenibacillus sp. ACRSA]